MGTPAVSNKKRLFAALVFVGIIFLLLVGRLFYLQIIKGPELQQKALAQWTRDTALTAARGKILDATGVVLAQSGTAYKILLWPNAIQPAERTRVATELAQLLDMDYAFVLERVSDTTKQEIVLKRKVEREVIDQIYALKLGNGVVAGLDTKRYYPNGSLFSQVLGFTTIDNVGQEGLEQRYEKYLAGEDGRMITETDRKGNSLPYGVQEMIDPIDGYDVMLTTNSAIQSFLEKALKEALKVNNAISAQGIIMNCKTGEIIALSTQPDYDPNNPPRSDITLLNSLTRNRIVSDAYEPGSTFKVLTLSAAIDSASVDSSTTFSCPGYYMVNGERIKCWKSGGHGGGQSLKKAVQNSCNPAFMRMALMMGKEKFYDYLYAFGLGSGTGSGIAGEAGGIVTNEKYIRDNTLARIGFGQSIAVTPIQLITAASAAVNGGNLMQPYIIKRVTSQSGEVILENEPKVIRQVIRESSSALVREILEGVVQEGSGKNAQIPGFRVGGKTGTAQKYEDGAVAQGKLIASFIGFAPADDPEFICLILVDEPKVGTIFGSTVAAPFVKQVMEETLYYYGYLPEGNDEIVTVPDVISMTTAEAKSELEKLGLEAVYQADDKVTIQIPKAGDKVLRGTQVLLYTSATDIESDSTAADNNDLVRVPSLQGMTKLQASDKLKERGLKILIDPPGQVGTVIRQSPAAGEMVSLGTVVLVEFSQTG